MGGRRGGDLTSNHRGVRYRFTIERFISGILLASGLLEKPVAVPWWNGLEWEDAPGVPVFILVARLRPVKKQ